MAKKKVVNIIEKGLEEREETLMVKDIYDKLEDYRKEHPESSFMIVSYNNKDKVGTSFLLGKEEDIALKNVPVSCSTKRSMRYLRPLVEYSRICFTSSVN